MAYDWLAEHLAALDPVGPVICTGHLASVQADPEDEPIRTLIVDFVENPAAEPEHGNPIPLASSRSAAACHRARHGGSDRRHRPRRSSRS